MDIIADISLNFQCLDDIMEMVQTVQCEYIKFGEEVIKIARDVISIWLSE